MHFNRLNHEKLMVTFLSHLNLAEEWGCGFVIWAVSKSNGSVLWTSAAIARLIQSQFHLVLVLLHP